MFSQHDLDALSPSQPKLHFLGCHSILCPHARAKTRMKLDIGLREHRADRTSGWGNTDRTSGWGNTGLGEHAAADINLAEGI